MSSELLRKRAHRALTNALSSTLDIQSDAIRNTDRIVADLGADSMATLTVLILVEEDLNISIDPDALQIADATVAEVCNRLVVYLAP
ncbi:MAG: hypothetical protein H6977_11320 [Gammaproteobacteria bacterium]|nr:hypothetical protein [Gammaproteobacteria bacterium]